MKGSKDPRIYNYISDTGIKQFERHIDKLFDQIFFEFMSNSVVPNPDAANGYNKGKNIIQIKECIQEFMNKYKLDPDHITFDKLQKSYYRYKALKKE